MQLQNNEKPSTIVSLSAHTNQNIFHNIWVKKETKWAMPRKFLVSFMLMLITFKQLMNKELLISKKLGTFDKVNAAFPNNHYAKSTPAYRNYPSIAGQAHSNFLQS